eukprot:scaffold101414_cov28-Tisochrysis_lutea.AAC.4
MAPEGSFLCFLTRDSALARGRGFRAFPWRRRMERRSSGSMVSAKDQRPNARSSSAVETAIGLPERRGEGR